MRDGLEFADRGMSFPIGGKTYVVPPIGMRTGTRLQAAAEGNADEEMKNLKGTPALKLILGTAYDEMYEDDVADDLVTRAFQSAMAYIQTGSKELAEAVWEAGSVGEFSAALAAAAAKAARTTKQPSARSTAAARKTRTPASSSGTSSRRATSSAKKPRSSPASPGR